MIDVITQLKLEPLFVLAVGAFPLMSICMCDDLRVTARFWKKSQNDDSLRPYRLYLILDRLTLHLPIWTKGLYYWIIGPKNIYPTVSLLYAGITLLLVLGPFLAVDPRWPKRTTAAYVIFYGTTFSHIIYILCYWGNIRLI